MVRGWVTATLSTQTSTQSVPQCIVKRGDDIDVKTVNSDVSFGIVERELISVGAKNYR